MVNHGTLAIAARSQQLNVTRRIWQLLSSSALLALVGALAFFLFLCALLIRQLPGYMANDPLATRWLPAVTEAYGILGRVLRALGLFDVLHNPVLQLLLALLALILLIRLANLLMQLWSVWQIGRYVATAAGLVGTPVPLPFPQPLYRLRQAVAQPPQAISEQMTQLLRAHFDEVIISTVAVSPYEATTERPEDSPGEAKPPVPVEELRLLARRHRRPLIWLRLLLLLGLLVALIIVWINLLAGWEVAPPLLAPGDEYRASTKQVALAYALPPVGEAMTPSLSAEIEDLAQTVPLGESRALRLGQIAIRTSLGPPAMVLRSTDSSITFSRPGQTQRTANLGLIFPNPGSEDAVVVENSVGLRIVRVTATPEADSTSPLPLAAQESFLVEVYQGDEVQPIETLQVRTETAVEIQIGDQSREILLIPLPSLGVTVHYQPGIGLLWLALGLILLGAVGFGYQPAFVLIQLAPWPVDRTVVVAQGDVADEIERIHLAVQEA